MLEKVVQRKPAEQLSLCVLREDSLGLSSLTILLSVSVPALCLLALPPQTEMDDGVERYLIQSSTIESVRGGGGSSCASQGAYHYLNKQIKNLMTVLGTPPCSGGLSA